MPEFQSFISPGHRRRFLILSSGSAKSKFVLKDHTDSYIKTSHDKPPDSPHIIVQRQV